MVRDKQERIMPIFKAEQAERRRNNEGKIFREADLRKVQGYQEKRYYPYHL